MESQIYDALREVFVLLAFQTQGLLRPYELTGDQYDALVLLSETDGWRMGELGKRVLSDNSKMTRTIDYLESRGWAERRSDSGDRRVQLAYLTTAGARQRERVQAARSTALAQWLVALDEAELAELDRLLTRLKSALQEQTAR